MEKQMTNKELIAALQRLNPDAIVNIEVKQYNKRYGRILSVKSSMPRDTYQFRVNATYGGCTITVHLPDKAIISNWPKYKL